MFRFIIRDLLWLTLVVAVGLGWFVHQRQLRADVDQAKVEAYVWQLRAALARRVQPSSAHPISVKLP